MRSINKKIYFSVVLPVLFFSFTACKQENDINILKGSALQHYCVGTLTDAIIYDIYSPPVASRLYAYCNLAYYEAIRPAYHTQSITNQLKGFEHLPEAENEKDLNPDLAGSTAFLLVAKKMIFSKDSIAAIEKSLLKQFNRIEPAVFKRSTEWGKKVAEVILARSAKDNYKITRGLPRYSVFEEEGKWQQTPPDYADATEPNWRMIIPLLMDSASQFKPPVPPAFDLKKGSAYQKELMELYEASKKLTAAQDTIARYWDDNPFVTQHQGHLTFANKKTTPVGHLDGYY